jgi:hypothetical protein
MPNVQVGSMSKWRFKKVRWLVIAPAILLLGTLIEFKAECAYCRSEFRKYFEGLAATEASVNPVQRAIFSLMLANAKPNPPATSSHRL